MPRVKSHLNVRLMGIYQCIANDWYGYLINLRRFSCQTLFLNCLQLKKPRVPTLSMELEMLELDTINQNLNVQHAQKYCPWSRLKMLVPLRQPVL